MQPVTFKKSAWGFLSFSDFWWVIKTQNKTITSNILLFFTRVITNNHKRIMSYKNDLLQKP